MICAKLYTKGSFASELSRPFFTPVLPQESVFAQFDAGYDETTLIVLTDNRSAPPADGKVGSQSLYTKHDGMSGSSVLWCCTQW